MFICMHCIFYSYNYAFIVKSCHALDLFSPLKGWGMWLLAMWNKREVSVVHSVSTDLNPSIFPSWHLGVLLGNLSKYFTINHFWEPFNCPAVLSEWLRHYPGALHHLTSCLLTSVLWSFFLLGYKDRWIFMYQAGCLGNGLYNRHWCSLCLDRVGQV